VARQLAPRRRPLAAVRGGAGGQERQADR
jgi:hypothetical protein